MPLKILKHIFLLVFLGGMLYTVFSYLPLLEEEVHSKNKFELANTQDVDDTAGSSGDEDDEKGAEDLFEHPFALLILSDDGGQAGHRFYLSHYIPPSRELFTPPPRLAA